MSRRPVVVVASAVLLAGLLLLAYAGSGGADAATRAISPAERHLADAYPRAAAAAYGRRVLVIHTNGPNEATADVFESARAGGGWELHPGAPPGADAFAGWLRELGAAAADDWDDDGAFDPATVIALAYGGVAIVVVEDGRQVVVSDRAARAEGLSAEASVPALRVRAAEPVLRVDAARWGAERRSSPIEPARVRGFQDGLWGGSVTVEAEEPGTYLFAWPRETAIVASTPVAPAAATDLGIPLVVLDLPAGDTEVSVTFETGSGRAGFAIAGAAAMVAAVLALLLALRPHPERDDPGPAA